MSDRTYLLRVRLKSTGGPWTIVDGRVMLDDGRITPVEMAYETASQFADKLWDQGYETQIIAVGHDELK